MAEERVHRRLAAILAADVVGYSKLIEANEEDTRSRLRHLQAELIGPRIAADGGRIVKTMGDGILAEFPSAVDAVRNALAIQTEMGERNANVPEDQRIVFRVGINVGDVIIEGDDIHGDGVNVAARLEGLCHPGDVYMSGNVFDQVSGRVEATFENLGEKTIKNITRPITVYRVRPQSPTVGQKKATTDKLPLPDRPSIAVLPFANMGGNPDDDFLGDGLAEDIITGLSRIRSFFVIARNSTFQYKGTSPDIRQVSADLGVRYVVEGSVRRAGNRIRVTVQLIDGQNGNHLWADRLDRDLDDIFAVQDEVTGTIVAQIEPELSRAEYERARLMPPDNMDAWELYHRGMAHYQRWTPDENLEARRFFELAVERDENFAAAHAGIAWSYCQEWFYKGREVDMAAAVSHAQKSVGLDEKNALGHVALGRAHHLNSNARAGKFECELALQLNPSLSTAHIILGVIHLHLRNASEAVSCVERGIRLSPFDPEIGVHHGRLANSYMALQDYETTLAMATKSVLKWNHWIPQCLIVASLGHLGRTEEARRELGKLEKLKPEGSIEFYRANWPPHHPDYIENIMEGLRKAGLTEK